MRFVSIYDELSFGVKINHLYNAHDNSLLIIHNMSSLKSSRSWTFVNTVLRPNLQTNESSMW